MNLTINKGNIVAILGPSGSGKTTLLNLISGLDTSNSGDIIVNGKNLIYLSDSSLTKFRANNVSFIFQSYNLLPTLNVLENVKTGSQLQKDKKKKMDEGMLLKKLGLFEERYKYPYQLSGGQQQRVSIARALAKNPSILFGDEPTGALDTETSVQVLETLVKINKDFGTTLVIVTHNPQIAKICDQVIKVKNGVVDKIIVNPKPLKPSQIK
jgi:putative ABC transport system ATP-binding protein